MELEASAGPLGGCDVDARVEVGGGLQVFTWLLFQLLPELLPFHRTDVGCEEDRQNTVRQYVDHKQITYLKK